MSYHPATPDEFEELLAQLDSLPPDRRAAIARMVFQAVDVCVICDEVVRRCDSRRIVEKDEQAAAHPHLLLGGERVTRDHPPARRETLRRAGLSMQSELTEAQVARADSIPPTLAIRSWWTFILHRTPEPKQRPSRPGDPLAGEIKTESQARSDRRRNQRDAERRRQAERTRTIRRCHCGCGKKIPPEADPRQKFFNGKHRINHHNRNKGQPTTPDTLRVSGDRKPLWNAESEGSKTEFCKLGQG